MLQYEQLVYSNLPRDNHDYLLNELPEDLLEKWEALTTRIANEALRTLSKSNKVMIEAPCGAGKSHWFIRIIEMVTSKIKSSQQGLRVDIISPTFAIADQTQSKIKKTDLEEATRIDSKNKNRAEESGINLFLQHTWVNLMKEEVKKVREGLDGSFPGYAIIDEGHKFLGKNSLELLKEVLDFKDLTKLIILSATPEYGWGEDRSLYDIFEDNEIIRLERKPLIEAGIIPPREVRLLEFKFEGNNSEIVIERGQYTPKSLELLKNRSQIVQKLTNFCLTHSYTDAYGKKRIVRQENGLVHWKRLKNSIEFVNKINQQAGEEIALHIDGTMDQEERLNVFNKYNDPNSNVKIISGYKIIGEGVDLPTSEWQINADPTLSLVEEIQRCERGRIDPKNPESVYTIFECVYIGDDGLPIPSILYPSIIDGNHLIPESKVTSSSLKKEQPTIMTDNEDGIVIHRGLEMIMRLATRSFKMTKDAKFGVLTKLFDDLYEDYFDKQKCSRFKAYNIFLEFVGRSENSLHLRYFNESVLLTSEGVKLFQEYLLKMHPSVLNARERDTQDQRIANQEEARAKIRDKAEYNTSWDSLTVIEQRLFKTYSERVEAVKIRTIDGQQYIKSEYYQDIKTRLHDGLFEATGLVREYNSKYLQDLIVEAKSNKNIIKLIEEPLFGQSVETKKLIEEKIRNLADIKSNNHKHYSSNYLLAVFETEFVSMMSDFYRDDFVRSLGNKTEGVNQSYTSYILAGTIHRIVTNMEPRNDIQPFIGSRSITAGHNQILLHSPEMLELISVKKDGVDNQRLPNFSDYFESNHQGSKIFSFAPKGGGSFGDFFEGSKSSSFIDSFGNLKDNLTHNQYLNLKDFLNQLKEASEKYALVPAEVAKEFSLRTSDYRAILIKYNLSSNKKSDFETSEEIIRQEIGGNRHLACVSVSKYDYDMVEAYDLNLKLTSKIDLIVGDIIDLFRRNFDAYKQISNQKNVVVEILIYYYNQLYSGLLKDKEIHLKSFINGLEEFVNIKLKLNQMENSIKEEEARLQELEQSYTLDVSLLKEEERYYLYQGIQDSLIQPTKKIIVGGKEIEFYSNLDVDNIEKSRINILKKSTASNHFFNSAIFVLDHSKLPIKSFEDINLDSVSDYINSKTDIITHLPVVVLKNWMEYYYYKKQDIKKFAKYNLEGIVVPNEVVFAEAYKLLWTNNIKKNQIELSTALSKLDFNILNQLPTKDGEPMFKELIAGTYKREQIKSSIAINVDDYKDLVSRLKQIDLEAEQNGMNQEKLLFYKKEKTSKYFPDGFSLRIGDRQLVIDSRYGSSVYLGEEENIFADSKIIKENNSNHIDLLENFIIFDAEEFFMETYPKIFAQTIQEKVHREEGFFKEITLNNAINHLSSINLEIVFFLKNSGVIENEYNLVDLVMQKINSID